jgi:hypothetical protein
MIKVVMVVTFILPGQQPYSYQIDNMTKLQYDVAKERLQEEYALKFPKLSGSYSVICLDREIGGR